jgi:16S rRNA (uracil1498-N3)-methyltransferase
MTSPILRKTKKRKIRKKENPTKKIKMSNPLFFRPKENLGEEIKLSQEEIEHLKSLRYFKYKQDYKVEFRDGRGLSVVYHFPNGGTRGIQVQKDQIFSQELHLGIATAIPKPGKLEYLLQKGTELGITHFYFINFYHSERKEINLDRSNRVIAEACAQSKRISFPEIELYSNFKDFIVSHKDYSFIYLHPYSESLLNYFNNQTIYKTIPIIGPEAGFHVQDIEIFQNFEIPSFRMNFNILRMETAATAITTIIQYERSKNHGSHR